MSSSALKFYQFSNMEIHYNRRNIVQLVLSMILPKSLNKGFLSASMTFPRNAILLMISNASRVRSQRSFAWSIKSVNHWTPPAKTYAPGYSLTLQRHSTQFLTTYWWINYIFRYGFCGKAYDLIKSFLSNRE